METTKRQCRKCSNTIPIWIKIDGKRKSLKNRKFCLDCSPWGRHNTSPTDPIERKKSSKNNEIVTLSLYKIALQRKADLIKLCGGCCKECGYCRNTRALSFHHLNRENKLFGLSLNIIWSRKWEELLNEVGKCVLLCLNCHAEIEGERSNIVARVNEKYGTNF